MEAVDTFTYFGRACARVAGLMALAALPACHDDVEPAGPSQPEAADAIAFAATVAASQGATRADRSVVNKNETSLEATTRQHPFCVGLFGAYTGADAWSASAEADFLFNQRMVVEAPDAAGVNALTYYRANTETYADSLVRFWPNGGGGTEKVSFWAYYPWNATDDPGEYGIHLVKAGFAGQGMGTIRYSMHEDASQHSDFMLSDLVPDCSKSGYPLTAAGTPTPVSLRFHHMLAQVRLYAFVRGTDRMVYLTDAAGQPLRADGDWLDGLSAGTTTTIVDEWGNSYEVAKDAEGGLTITNVTLTPHVTLTREAFTALGLKVPDEEHCVRWDREGGVWDVTRKRRRANIQYTLTIDNIYTQADFTPAYADGKTTFAYSEAGVLGHVTVTDYHMNPYWFKFVGGERVMLNDRYMYGPYEGTPAALGKNATAAAGDDTPDGIDWSQYALKEGMTFRDPLNYLTDGDGQALPRAADLLYDDGSGHYNYAPGNIIMAVPQRLLDNNVPRIIVQATGTDARSGETITARVTVNMIGMDIKWESGFIYSYAFIDNDLRPGDDKVKGPASITAVFDPTHYGDQW